MGYYNIYNFIAGAAVNFLTNIQVGNLGSGSWLYWDSHVNDNCYILDSKWHKPITDDSFSYIISNIALAFGFI